MNLIEDYLAQNKAAWNNKTDVHIQSAFYNNKSFLEGRNTLNQIELELLGDVSGKSVLHLQCHFGQDSLSLSRMGAHVTGIDFSDKAIERAREFNALLGLNATFHCCDVYDASLYLNEKFDIVFTSYGTIGWLPNLDRWAEVVSNSLKPGGKFIMSDFHPVVWMMNNNFSKIEYCYFNEQAILETESGTYADKNAPISSQTVSWNHSTSELLNSLLTHGLQLVSFNEYDYSPYPCFNQVTEVSPGKFQITHLGNKIPMVYSILATKNVPSQ